MPKNSPNAPFLVAFWIGLCAYLNCAGWLLSAFHQLNLAGYAVLSVQVLGAFVWWQRNHSGGSRGWRVQTLRHRFKRLFPLAFFALAILAFLGGALHAPTNYDALSYRIPRVLNWLAEGQWHWIHTNFQRLNTRACGYEWLAAPVILLTKSDRLLFLISFISYMFLPGLIFSLFTRLGVRPRVAWHWMWLLPSAYCFVLQAGSIGNDLFGAVFALAAVDFALRANASRRPGDLWLSCLAAALLTGSKASNLPLLLPWLIAVIPSLSLIRKHLVSTAAVGLVVAGASLLPMAALNIKHCGDWSGAAAEHAQFGKGPPLLYFTQNSALLVIQNFVPPIFPIASKWNQAVPRLISPERAKKLEENFEPAGARLGLTEMQIEEDAGAGFGVSLMLLLSLAGGLLCSKAVTNSRPPPQGRLMPIAVRLSGYVSLLVFMIKSGLTTLARLITPYYGLLIPSLLAGERQARVVRSVWWKRGALLVFLLAGLLLIVSPARPLWPALSVLSKLDHGNSALIKRAETVYSVYGSRADGFAPLRAILPADATVVGLVSFDDPETSLWRPFMNRRVRHVLPEDTAEDLQSRGIKYVLINPEHFARYFNETFEQWLGRIHGELIKTVPLTLRAGRGSIDWQLVKLRPPDIKKT